MTVIYTVLQIHSFLAEAQWKPKHRFCRLRKKYPKHQEIKNSYQKKMRKNIVKIIFLKIMKMKSSKIKNKIQLMKTSKKSDF